MSNCLCLACDLANLITTKFCNQCGAKLQIQERYRALRIIGQGGFGKTFLAQDDGKPSKPKCVIKQFIYDDPATLREAQRLFEQEAVRLDDLGKHNQIPELLAHCEQEGRQYLVQEFIDGENLLQELNRAGRFSEVKIKELLLDLLPVLQFIHSGQVIHRDIKPENIIRRRSDGRLVLVDFGAAKVATQTALQKTATTIGSPEYTAPEQAKGKPVYASDIYALGVSSIYLLTQISPFDLFSDSEFQWVWRQFLNGITVNDKLGRVLDKMLEQALVRRYQTIEDVLQDLDLPKNPPISMPVRSQQIPVSTSSNSLVLDCGNGVKLELVKVAAGSFNMGSNEYDDEEPIHRVSLREFFIGKYPVTQAQYQAVIGKNPSNFEGSQNPVEGVYWHDAVKFCEELSKRIGQKVKLPSEAQWEYACRAGSTGKYCFGDDDSKLGNYAWYDTNTGNETHPVGEKLANSWGLHDMHGNVWEWCEDIWHENYNGAPTDGSSWLTGGDQNRRALRGGSCFYSDIFCRSANRDTDIADNCNCIDFGFRVVVSNSLVLDCGNGVKLELVKVAAGSFNMGSNEYDDEEPIHRVSLREFFIGKYPVTQAQYQAVIGKNPSNFEGSQNPVEGVYWHDAVKFCEELSKRIGQKVKLPSEAQWEYACRAGSTGEYCFGDDVSELGNYAWYKENSASKTHPVGEKLANSWGLHDMHGNVWEWCEDIWHENYNGAPTDGSSWLTGGDPDIRAQRGGSWGYVVSCRSAYRSRSNAGGCDDYGFRVVVSNSLVLDCGNGVKLELVKVAAGSFNMGSNEYDDEEPIHRVSLREFFIGKYPVTQAQYQAVIGENPSNFEGSQNPVEDVSWHDAVKFCEELSKRIGQKVKLPSEAQWEYACRAGSTGKYCFGDDVNQLEKYAWYDKNSGHETHPVGEKLANSWGLHDMHGNVWEWCEDIWHENYNGAPTDGSSWLTGGDPDIRALRGGSWGNVVNNCRSADRYWDDADGSDFGGFRVVV